MTSRARTAVVALLAFAAAFVLAGVAIGGESDQKADADTLGVRLSAVAELPVLAEDPAVLALERARARRAERRARRIGARRRAAARRATAAEPVAAAPVAPEPAPLLAPEPVPPPAPAPAPPPPPPPQTFYDSG